MHESGRTVLANGFAAKKNWFRANRERNRVKARSGNSSTVVLCLLAFCALPSANRAQFNKTARMAFSFLTFSRALNSTLRRFCLLETGRVVASLCVDAERWKSFRGSQLDFYFAPSRVV